MRPYLLGLNIFQSGKHHTKIYLRADFSNRVHHQVEISKSESAKGVERALMELASKIREDAMLGK
jgi:hypothetical protein